MSVHGIGSLIGSGTQPPASGNPSNSSATDFQNALSDASGTSPEQAFLDYMKKSPGQRMIDAWLKAHGLTEQSLQKLPPQQREAVEKEMAQDIKRQAEDKTKSGLSALG